MNQGVHQHDNLDDVPAAGATNADTPAVGELCDSLIIEPEFIDAVGQSKRAMLVVIGILIQPFHQSSGQSFLSVATHQRYGDQRERVATERATEINDSVEWNMKDPKGPQ